VTAQVECRPGPFGTKVPLKSSAARAGLAKPTAAAAMATAARPAVTFMLPPVAGDIRRWRQSRTADDAPRNPLFASKTDPSAPNF
jgi:hypothetical protein